MRICRILTNNALVVLDEKGKEQIVCGKGIGYKKRPGDNVDDKLVETVYVKEGDQSFEQIRRTLEALPEEYLLLAQHIVEAANVSLNMKLNPVMAVSLADHLFYAIQRFLEGTPIANSLTWEIKRFYQKEYEVGLMALDMVESQFKVRLPESEAAFIAMHIKGILSIAVLCGLPSDSGYYQLFNAIGDAIFYFMPMLLGMNLAKKFAIDPVFGFLVGAAMLYPTIQGVDLNLFGMTVNATYTSTFLPVVFTMAIAIPLYKWLEKRVSKLVKSFMVPAIALAVAVPLGFSLVGPAANMVGNALNVVLTVIFDTVPLVAFIIFGGLYQVFVLFGIHGAICMVPFMELLQGHPVRMLVCTLIPCFAQTGVVLAVCLKTKDKKLKDIALPAFFSGIFGVTEPAIYGVTLPRIKMFVIACIGAAAGSAVGAITGLTLYSYAGMGVIGLLGMINPNGATNFVGIILMVAVAFGFSFVMAWFTYKDEDGTSENILTEQGEKNQKKSAPRTEKSAMALQKVEIAAPLSGTVKPLGECSDEAFSTEVLGKGVVILPENGIVMAPFDGVVENLFSTRHAIALTDKTGCNVLIHIGMNTVRLDGEGFKAFVKQGDTVKKGDKLLEVDINSIHEKGYSLETPVLVTNADDYADVIEMASGSVKAGAPLLTALK